MAAVSGDVRRMLELCRKASELAKEDSIVPATTKPTRAAPGASQSELPKAAAGERQEAGLCWLACLLLFTHLFSLPL